MRVVVIRIVSGESTTVGFLRRYLFEMETGFLLGSVTAPLERGLLDALESRGTSGYMIVSCRRSAAGYRIPYFSMPNARVIDLDGLALVEKYGRSKS